MKRHIAPYVTLKADIEKLRAELASNAAAYKRLEEKVASISSRLKPTALIQSKARLIGGPYDGTCEWMDEFPDEIEKPYSGDYYGRYDRWQVNVYRLVGANPCERANERIYQYCGTRGPES